MSAGRRAPGADMPGAAAGKVARPRGLDWRHMTSLAPIGGHVPVAGGLARGALRYASEIGAEMIQVFVTNPRGWALTAGDPAQDVALRASGMPSFVHAPYLVNLGSPTAETVERSVATVRHCLLRARAIGARGVVVHTGSAVDRPRETALRQIRERLLPLMEEIPDDGPDLLLEPMAGQGAMLCGTVQELEPYLAALDRHPKVGVCLDTCHAFAAGHDLSTPEGMATTLDALHAIAPGRLRLIHANDSKDVCGSRRDRHENIGAGHIGALPFGALMRHPAAAGVPLCVETPGGAGRHREDIATLKRLRDGSPRPAGAGRDTRPP
ncbi:putative endonuclease 4 [Streptosporangium violaceochromogenes]|nr:putative endonuclease 4 [Streptosporangium violaceochromogenes]